MRLTLLEDDATLAYTIKRYFKEKEYEVRHFSTLKEALSHSISDDFYLVDVSLPDGEGYTYAKKIREHSNAPIIFLSVRDDQKSLLTGFDSGADDYLTKPFSFKELDMRMTALNKRVKSHMLEISNLLIDTDKATIKYKDEEILLSVQEYRMLLLLVRNQERVVLREEFNDLLNIEESFQDNTLNVAMRRLRKKLAHAVDIEVVVKQGYRIKEK